MSSNLKEMLRQGKVALGGWLTSSSGEVAEAMASLGFDWIVVDMEHGTSGIADAAAAFVAIERHGAAPLVRLPSADPYLARRVLDAGGAGVVVPVVENAKDFDAFARHLHYRPKGARGAAIGRFNAWGDGFAGYFNGFEPVIVGQIETKAGVAAADEIAALDGVDGLFLGPYDLSADLGAPGNFETQEMRSARATVLAACASHGKAAGIHQVEPDPDALDRVIGEGFTFVAYGTDMLALRHALRGGVARVKP